MQVKSFEDLKSVCSSCQYLYEILAAYTDCKDICDIVHELMYNDATFIMADENGMEEDDLCRWIMGNWNDSVKCKAFEIGPANCPYIEIKVYDRYGKHLKTFHLDWFIEDVEV